MNNIRSSKKQGGFIGELLGLAAGLFLCYLIVMLGGSFLVMTFVDDRTMQEKSGLSVFEYAAFSQNNILKKKLGCGKNGVVNFDCDESYDVWLKTPKGNSWAVEYLGKKAEWEWSQKYDRTELNASNNVVNVRADPKINPCVFEYLGKKYNCAKYQ